MFNFRHKDKGYGLLLPTIACAALIGGVAVGITKMSNVSVKAVTSTKTKYTGQQYALNTADKYCRLTNYASLAGFEKRKINGSDDYYEEVIVTDNTVPLYQGAVETGSAPSKDITVNVYHKEGDRMPLVSSVKLYRTDPATFDPNFNMVANDAASTSENQALSANAFREMLNSKVSGNIAFGSDVAMSANASKLYIDSVLKNYALTDSTVGIRDLNDAGTAHRGVYVDAEGFIKPTDIIIRGNKSTEADPLILIPVKLPDGSWVFDSLRKSKLGKGANQTYTVSIKQTPNQTITVTTSDGTKHTSDFTANIGTTWTATVDADTGYNAGKLIASSGTVNGATTVSATEATIKTFDFNITQSAHQTITVTTGDGVKHTSSFVAKYGTTWTAQVVADGSSSDSNLDSSLLPEKEIEFVLDKDGGKTSITIPAGVRVIKLCAYAYADPTIQTISANSYIRDDSGDTLVSADALSDNGGENPGDQEEIYMGVVPGQVYNFYCYVSGLDSGTDANVSISYSKKINSCIPDIGTSSSQYELGNLVVNGTDTGSTTGSGTVTGTMNVSAKPATVKQPEIEVELPEKETTLTYGWGLPSPTIFDVTIPPGVYVIKVSLMNFLNDSSDFGIYNEANLKYYSLLWLGTDEYGQGDGYIKVTPNKTYTFYCSSGSDGSSSSDVTEYYIYYSKSINKIKTDLSADIIW